LLLLALDLDPGDEVVLPAYTFPATAGAIVHARGRPVFCDVDGVSGVSTLEHIVAATGPRTRAIIAVHLFGYPMSIRAVEHFAERRGIPLLLDAAGALGTLVDGRLATTAGWGAALSFHPRKLVTTGEGGAVVTDDIGLAERCRRLRHHGLDEGGVLTEPGINYRLSSLQAAIGIPQLDRLAETLRVREQLARTYDELLENSVVRPAPRSRSRRDRHAWQAYVAQAPETLRDGILAKLRTSGVEVQFGTYLVPGCPPYAGSAGESEYPGARLRAASDLALPLFDGITRAQQERVAALLADAAGQL
jgi:dTDP-4-amino-4,6-dideoxygalactose transaminase